MATKKTSHILRDEEQLAAITKRIKRAHGQMGAIIRMLEEGRSCEDIVTQMAAVAKAVNTAAFTLISASLKECIADPESDTDDIVRRLQKLFLSLA
jgi:DNA-binding FrmR family transcriptional regulator